ncbi:MAG: hypothetical protein EOO61_22685 [Hymenobacter sp.]|nr:MAG: hypothetical protein EOO61_22685 [Hymenobacter sp.]
MREPTAVVYCFLDNLLTLTLPSWVRLVAPYHRLTDAQVLTKALFTSRFFGGNLVLGQRYREQHWGQNSRLY